MTPLSTMLCLCTTSSLPRLAPSVSCSLWGHPISHLSVPVRQPRSLFIRLPFGEQAARWPVGLCACTARSGLARVLRTLGYWLLTVYQFGCSSVLPLEPSCPPRLAAFVYYCPYPARCPTPLNFPSFSLFLHYASSFFSFSFSSLF